MSNIRAPNLTPILKEMVDLKNLLDDFIELHEDSPDIFGDSYQLTSMQLSERFHLASCDLKVVMNAMDIMILRMKQTMENFDNIAKEYYKE